MHPPSDRRSNAVGEMRLKAGNVVARVGWKKDAFATQLALLDTPAVSLPALVEAAASLMPGNYDDVVTERALAHRCGYPACANAIAPTDATKPRGKYKIVYSQKRVYDARELAKFCSTDCLKKSAFFGRQVSTLSVDMRDGPSYRPPVPLEWMDDSAPAEGALGSGALLDMTTPAASDDSGPVQVRPSPSGSTGRHHLGGEGTASPRPAPTPTESTPVGLRIVEHATRKKATPTGPSALVDAPRSQASGGGDGGSGGEVGGGSGSGLSMTDLYMVGDSDSDDGAFDLASLAGALPASVRLWDTLSTWCTPQTRALAEAIAGGAGLAAVSGMTERDRDAFATTDDSRSGQWGDRELQDQVGDRLATVAGLKGDPVATDAMALYGRSLAVRDPVPDHTAAEWRALAEVSLVAMGVRPREHGGAWAADTGLTVDHVDALLAIFQPPSAASEYLALL